MAVNGSSADGGCVPTSCMQIDNMVNSCYCGAYTALPDNSTTGIHLDGAIPTIDVTERNMTNETVWAAPLFTVRGSSTAIVLTFKFPAPVILREVELYIFFCPPWGIGAEGVHIHNSATYPTFFRLQPNRGSVTKSDDDANCESLIRVSIPLEMADNTSNYAIEFINPSGNPIKWVHIAEVRFSDDLISTATGPGMYTLKYGL